MSAKAADLANALDDTPFPDFAQCVDQEINRRFARLAHGILAYRQHPYRRTLSHPATIWSQGSTRLLDYGPTGGIPILVVPSLINRYHILDLTDTNSLMRHLASRGLRPLLVDWQEPAEDERTFDLTAYIAGRLEAALDAVLLTTGGRPVAIVGYCMGGLLALALALRRQADITSLTLLATPWDFHAGSPTHVPVFAALSTVMDAVFHPIGHVPTDCLQSLFMSADPQLAIEKFLRFAEMDRQSPEAEAFVAVEDWLNDGVPLALPLAKECFGGWYGRNETALGRWRVAGRVVEPMDLRRPCLIIAPMRDRLVPPKSSHPLAARIAGAQLAAPALGHIGLIVGRRAPDMVWPLLADWLHHPVFA